MKCDGCSADNSAVCDTRSTSVTGVPSIRRRRKCLECGARWTTYEIRAGVAAPRESAGAQDAPLQSRDDDGSIWILAEHLAAALDQNDSLSKRVEELEAVALVAETSRLAAEHALDARLHAMEIALTELVAGERSAETLRSRSARPLRSRRSGDGCERCGGAYHGGFKCEAARPAVALRGVA